MWKIVIVGGGYSGAAFAAQCLRTCPAEVALTIVEPRDCLGAGLAYSTNDPDHRLNGPPDIHTIDIEDVPSFARWCESRAVAETDPEAVAEGTTFVRRAEFGRYLDATLRALAAASPRGSTLEHVRDCAVGLRRDAGGCAVVTARGMVITADVVILATGNALPRLPAPLAPGLVGHPAVIESPTELDRIRAIPRDARVLVLGTGLTALDVLSTILRTGHRGAIEAVSRRGLRPAAQRPRPAVADPLAPGPLARVHGPLPGFVDARGYRSIRRLLRALRTRIRENAANGESWYTPFDEVRDVLWQFWPTMPANEKRRFQRHLRAWYDAHRFRAPPQNVALAAAAEADGRLRYRTARVVAARPLAQGRIEVSFRDRGAAGLAVESFDAIVNCTGLDPASGIAGNPLLSALAEHGVVKVDASGIGLAVDTHCRAIDRADRADPRLRIVGPPTAGVFGDPLGGFYIAAQILRLLPDIYAELQAADVARASGTAMPLAGRT